MPARAGTAIDSTASALRDHSQPSESGTARRGAGSDIGTRQRFKFRAGAGPRPVTRLCPRDPTASACAAAGARVASARAADLSLDRRAALTCAATRRAGPRALARDARPREPDRARCQARIGGGSATARTRAEAAPAASARGRRGSLAQAEPALLATCTRPNPPFLGLGCRPRLGCRPPRTLAPEKTRGPHSPAAPPPSRRGAELRALRPPGVGPHSRPRWPCDSAQGRSGPAAPPLPPRRDAREGCGV